MSTTELTGIPELSCHVAGEEVGSELLDVIYPYSGELAGRVPVLKEALCQAAGSF